MATTYTEHLQIPKHSPTDPFNIALINEGFDKTEAGILAAYRGMVANDLLRNSDFINPVNQRMQTSYTGAIQYTIDGWKTTNVNTAVDVLDGGIKLTNTVAASGGYLQQIMENPAKMLGKTYTLAAKQTNGKITVASGTLPVAFPDAIMQYATMSDDGVTVGAIQVSTNSVWVRIWSNPNEETRSFEWARLFEGEYTLATLPSCAPKRYAAELLECQRHVIPLGGFYRYRAVQITSSYVDFCINLPIKMRATPTFNKAALTVYGMSNGVVTTQSGFTFAILQVTATGIVIRATKANHGCTDAFLNIVDGTVFSAEQ